MYIVSDVIEVGTARELILNQIKVEFVGDDVEPYTCWYGEGFDE